MYITVFGAGVVGTATGKGLIRKGHHVTFIDINDKVVERLRGENHRAFLPEEVYGSQRADAIMICISTPPDENGAVDLSYIIGSMEGVARLLKGQTRWPVVVIRSTVPPTTTEQILIPLLEQHSGMVAGEDFGVCMNPEFLRAVSSTQDFDSPWVTVIGELNKRSGDVLERLYRSFGGKLVRVSLSEAEFIKYGNNLRNALIISFNNEMWLLARKIGIADPNNALAVVTDSAESAWNPKYGSKGGYPYGGSCLAKDTNALLNFATQNGMAMLLLGAVIQVNNHMNDLASEGEVAQAQIVGHFWQPSPALKEDPKLPDQASPAPVPGHNKGADNGDSGTSVGYTTTLPLVDPI
jgi:UDPglucose 6-dehydrogenase